VLGLPAGVGAAVWLVLSLVPGANAKLAASLVIYALGLIGMLAASAAYHLARPGDTKARLRPLDHAMIFVMIAGTYTPFALNILPPRDGLLLCAAVWIAAAIGIALRLALRRRYERLLLLLYLAMGWMVLGVGWDLIARLARPVVLLLLAGGIAYSLGAIIHTLNRLRFHIPIWHIMVLIGAGLHLAALTQQFDPAH
jgi:hemolysin III